MLVAPKLDAMGRRDLTRDDLEALGDAVGEVNDEPGVGADGEMEVVGEEPETSTTRPTEEPLSVPSPSRACHDDAGR